MRKLSVVVAVLLTGLLAVFAVTTLRAERGAVNGSERVGAGERRLLTEEEIVRRARHFAPEWQGTLGSGVECEIRKPDGSRALRVPEADFGAPAYWFYYTSNFVRASEVQFVAFPAFEGSPLRAITQRFVLDPPDDTDILTPFGVPGWAFDRTTGPWVLVVIKDRNEAGMCRFNVVPE
jgi:hypothetical protein